MNMRNFAKHILAVSYENNISVNNLGLHKIMYFAMKEQKDNYKLLSQMYDEPFYVWRYGPTIPSIHKKYSGYGSRAIIEDGKRNDKYSIFDDSIIKLLHEDLFLLISESCKHNYWLSNRNKIVKGKSDIKYRLEDILDNSKEVKDE